MHTQKPLSKPSKNSKSQPSQKSTRPVEKRIQPTEKITLHPRNQHRARYDFDALIITSPLLATFVKPNAYGDASIDFSNPKAVIALNKALLLHHYAIRDWDIPAQFLCPPIPGRADYIHYLADLISNACGEEIPRGNSVRVLDIGTGANLVYPLVGHSEYGWHFVGADIDEAALHNANTIIKANIGLESSIELRLQQNSSDHFKGVIQAGECYHITMCNPPFHASLEEAEAGTKRKLQGLAHRKSVSHQGKVTQTQPTPHNFGGNSHELIYVGGEEAFVCGMVAESKSFATQVLWFTSLISKETTLPAVYHAFKQVGAMQVKTIGMAQGQKKSRFVAWTFHPKDHTQHIKFK